MTIIAPIVLAGIAYVVLSLLRFGRTLKIIAMFGVALVAAGVGPLDYLRAAGNVRIASRAGVSDPLVGQTLEVRPKVAGDVSSIPVQPGAFAKKGMVLLQLDRAPFEAKVRDAEAALAKARDDIVRLKSELAAATAAVEAAQSRYNDAVWRLNDLEHRADQAAFKLQYATAETDLLAEQVRTATEHETATRKAYESGIGPAALAVARCVAQLSDAQLALEQTTVRAPADGYVNAPSLTVGSRVSPDRAALSLVLADGIINRERYLADGAANRQHALPVVTTPATPSKPAANRLRRERAAANRRLFSSNQGEGFLSGRQGAM
jgi:multidrug resistance efflux pump